MLSLRCRNNVAVSVALHAAAALLLLEANTKDVPPRQPAEPAFVWVTPTIRERTAESDIEVNPAPMEPQESPTNTVPIPAVESRANGHESETRATDERSGVRGRLLEARQRASSETQADTERERAYRSFTFPGTIGEQDSFTETARRVRAERGLQQLLTAFDSPSKGRAGLTERTAMGQEVRWTSDECFQTIGSGNLFALPATAGLYGVPITTCVRTRARDDLFETAKPAYLQDERERAAANADFVRRDRTRNGR